MHLRKLSLLRCSRPSKIARQMTNEPLVFSDLLSKQKKRLAKASLFFWQVLDSSLSRISVVATSKLCKAVLFVVVGVADASPQTLFATMFSSVRAIRQMTNEPLVLTRSTQQNKRTAIAILFVWQG